MAWSLTSVIATICLVEIGAELPTVQPRPLETVLNSFCKPQNGPAEDRRRPLEGRTLAVRSLLLSDARWDGCGVRPELDWAAGGGAARTGAPPSQLAHPGTPTDTIRQLVKVINWPKTKPISGVVVLIPVRTILHRQAVHNVHPPGDESNLPLHPQSAGRDRVESQILAQGEE